MDELDRLGWAVSRSYEVADIAFGVRTNSEQFALWLDETLDAYRIAEELPAYYSILIAEAEKHGKRFHLLYEESRVLVRSLDPVTIGRALLSQFEQLRLPQRDDALYAEMTVVGSDGRYALVPPLFLPLLEGLSYRVVERANVVLPYSMVVAIDPDSGRVIPVPPSLDVPLNGLDRLAHLNKQEATEARISIVEPAAVDVVVSFGGLKNGSEVAQPISKALACYRAASHTLNLRTLGVEVGLAALRQTVESASCYEFSPIGSKPMLEAVSQILRA